METIYMMTIIYAGGKVLDLEFSHENEREQFHKCINQAECDVQLWEDIR